MSTYYVGPDVHKASIRVAVLNAAGKLVTEPVVETGAATVPAPPQGSARPGRSDIRGRHSRRPALRPLDEH